jgi:hypothetical protein
MDQIKTKTKQILVSISLIVLCFTSMAFVSQAVAVPTCVSNPLVTNGTYPVEITCKGVDVGSKLELPNTTCAPLIATASKEVICTENPNANLTTKPTLTITGSDNSKATTVIDYTFDNIAPKTPTVNPIPTANSNPYPSISGTCEPISTVQLLLGVSGYDSDLLYATCLDNGTYTLDPNTVAFPVGTNVNGVSVNSYDKAGNLSTSALANVPVTRTGADITAPNAPRVILIPEFNQDQQYPLEAACEPAATVTFRIYNEVLQAKCANNGSSKVYPNNKVPYGPNTDAISVTQVDEAGNVSKVAMGSYPVTNQASTTTLLPPIVDRLPDANTNPLPIITGKCMVGAKVNITPVVGTVVEGVCASNGTFAIKLVTPLDLGPNQADLIIHQYTPTAKSANIVFDAPLSTTKVDTTAPIAPTINAISSSNRDVSPIISGSCEVGAKVVIMVNNKAVPDAICTNGATYSSKVGFIVPISNGNTIVVKQIDNSNNVSPVANATFVVLGGTDTIAPAIPKSEPILTTNTDVTPIIRGTCEPFAKLKLTLAGKAVSPDQTCGPNGRFAFDMEEYVIQIPIGKNPDYIRLIQTDEAGNTSGIHTADAPVSVPTRLYTSTPIVDQIPTTNTNPLPEISGGCEPGITVEVTTYISQSNGIKYKTPCLFGRYKVTPTVPFKIGTFRAGIDVVQVDSNGKTSYHGFGDVFVVKKVDLPILPTATVNPIANTNISPKPIISGSCTAGYEVNIIVYGNSQKVMCPSNGQYSVTSDTVLAPNIGQNKIEVKQAKGGVNSASVFTDAPFNEPSVKDPMYLPDYESYYNSYDTTPIISGDNCNTGYEVTVILPQETLKTICKDLGPWANNHWSVQTTKDLPRGANTNIGKVYQTNFINKSSNQIPFSVKIDPLSSPLAKVIIYPIPTDNKNPVPIITGQCLPNHLLIIQVGAQQEYIYCGENALFELPILATNPLPAGANVDYITAFQSIEGKFSDVTKASAPNNSTNIPVIKDTTPPTDPTINPIPSNNTMATPAITGSCETDATLTISLNSSLVSVVCKSAKYTFVPAISLNIGSNEIKIYQTDPSGNKSGEVKANISYTKNTDTTPPTKVIITSISQDQKPIISGTCEAGAYIYIYVMGELQPNVICDANGKFSTTSVLPLPTGANVGVIKITQVDPAGNISPEATVDAPIADNQAPTAPTVNVIPTNNTNTKPLITGGCEPQAKVFVKVNGTDLTSVTCSSSGLYQSQVVTALPTGPNVGLIKVYQVDAAGNKSTESTANAPILDNIPPAKPVINPISASNNNRRPVITGTCEENAKVYVNVNGQNFATTCKAGVFSVTPTKDLPYGTNANLIEVWQLDESGNKSDTAKANAPVTDSIAPIKVTIDPIPTTNINTKPTITGTCVTGNTVKLVLLLDTIFAACVNGKYSIATLVDLPTGPNTNAIVVTQTDTKGLESEPVRANAPILDNIPPIAPTINPIPTTNSSSTIKVQGTCETGASVFISINNIQAPKVLCSNSTYLYEVITTLTFGPNNNAIIVYQQDLSGNKSPETKANAPIIDNIAPLAPTIDPIPTTNTNKRPIVKGNCEKGATVEIKINSIIENTQTCSVTGTYTFTLTKDLPEGANAGYIQVSQKDQASNISPIATANAPLVDSTPPLVVTMNPILAANNNNLPVITGTCETNATVELSVLTIKYQANCTAGTYSIQITTPLPTGPNPSLLTLIQIDPSGNKSPSITKDAPVTNPTTQPTPKLRPPTVDQVPSDNTNPLPTITGTCIPTATVLIDVLGTLYQTPCNSSKYSLTLTTNLSYGYNTQGLRVSQKLPNGSQSDPIKANIPLINTRLIKPTVNLIPLTNTNQQPLISGSCTVGTTVVIKSPTTYTQTPCNPKPLRMAFMSFTTFAAPLAAAIGAGEILDGTYSDYLVDIFNFGPNANQIEVYQVDNTAGLTSDIAITDAPVIDTIVPLPINLDPITEANTDSTPNIKGSCEDGADVYIKYLGQAPILFPCTLGVFFVTPSTELKAGNNIAAIEVYQVDKNGNQSASIIQDAYYTDLTAPEIPIVDSIPKTNTNSQPTITGVCQSPSIVTLSFGGRSSITVNCVNDVFTYTLDYNIPSGANKDYILTYATDQFGNISEEATYDLPVNDTSAPDAPSIDPLPFDNFNQVPIISGECPSDGVITLTVGKVDTYTTDCKAGFWSVQVTNPIPVGPYLILATVTDSSGQTSQPGISKELITQKDDVTAPSAVTINPINPDNTSKRPTITINCEYGTQLLIKVLNIIQGAIGCSYEGTATFEPNFDLSPKFYTKAISVIQTDPSGNSSPIAYQDIPVNIQTANRLMLDVMQLANTDTTPTLEGECSGYNEVEITVNNQTFKTQCIGDKFSITTPLELPNGLFDAKIVGIRTDGSRIAVDGKVPVNVASLPLKPTTPIPTASPARPKPTSSPATVRTGADMSFALVIALLSLVVLILFKKESNQ